MDLHKLVIKLFSLIRILMITVVNYFMIMVMIIIVKSENEKRMMVMILI